METSLDPATERFFPPPAPLPLPERKPRRWLHPVLFGLTCWTTYLAGVDLQEGWRSAVEFALAVLAIMIAHEMGHYIACRRHGIPATLPYFLPGLPSFGAVPPIPPFGTFGAVIRIKGAIPTRKALFDVAAAGPIAGFVVALATMAVGVIQATPVAAPPEGTVSLGTPLVGLALERLLAPSAGELLVGKYYVAGLFGMLLTSLNLFAVGQLDGGHAVYAVFPRAHRKVSYGMIFFLMGLCIYQALVLRTPPQYVLWVVILWVLRDRHPRLIDESSGIGTPRVIVATILLGIAIVSFIPQFFVF